MKRHRHLQANPHLIPLELERCSRDVFHFFDWWAWTFDPRLAGVPDQTPWQPFDLFDRQREFILWIDDLVKQREDGLTEKSRTTGFTWMMGGYVVHKWRFRSGYTSTFGSRNLDLVDKIGDPKSIFEKVRMFIRGLPKWMRPKGFVEAKHFKHGTIINPENGAIISGEGGDQMGRGGRSSLYVIDEAAFIDRADLVDASTSANADVRIWGSTVNGPGNLFYRKRHNGKMKPRQIFRLHYSDDPRCTPEWIAKKKNSMEAHMWASEYEIDYSASIEGICIPASWVESAKKIGKLVYIEPAVEGIGGGDVGAGKAKSVFVARFGPVVTVPVAWGQPDTIETAHRMLDAATEITMMRSDGTQCRVTSLRYDNVGVGQGVESALAHSQAHDIITAGVNVGVPPSDMAWPDGGTSAEKFANLKGEAWSLMREAFKSTHEKVLFLEGKEGGRDHPISDCISLPDDTHGPEATTLASQISLVKRMRNEKGKIAIEQKAALASRGIASPDYAEALVLTYTGYSDLEIWRKLGA